MEKDLKFFWSGLVDKNQDMLDGKFGYLVNFHRSPFAPEDAVVETNSYRTPKRESLRKIPEKTVRTMLTDNQLLNDHGLLVVGDEQSGQWLLPEALTYEDQELGNFIFGRPVPVKRSLDDAFSGTNFGSSTTAKWKAAFEARVKELREAAGEEDVSLNEASIAYARIAADLLVGAERPSIFLVGNGNLRFVWFAHSGAQVGWQFLPNGRIQFVMLGGEVTPEDKFYGEAALEVVLRQLRQSNFADAVFV